MAHIEVLHGHSSTTIVLEDLVTGALGTSTVNVACSTGLLERGGILAYVEPPDIVESASPKAMDTLAIIGADNDIGERGTGLENENCIRITPLSLVIARANYLTFQVSLGCMR